MSDVLAITVEIDGRYPSVNHTGGDGFRGGRKSREYRQLFARVKYAALDEMARTGWTKAECDCFVSIVRYIPDMRRCDAMNLGKTELDALTAAGVWLDDNLANPPMAWIRRDIDGKHRVSIVVVKLYESHRLIVQLPSPTLRTPKEKFEAASAAMRGWRAGDPIPEGYADLNGTLVTREEALAAIRGSK